MMLIGEDEAAEIMGNLSPREVQVLGSAMYSVQGLGQDTVNLVLDEFLAIIKAQTSLGISGGGYIKNVLTKSLGEDKAQTVLGKITPSDSNKAIEILDWLDARSVADLIIDEHPQIIALIISIYFLSSAFLVIIIIAKNSIINPIVINIGARVNL